MMNENNNPQQNIDTRDEARDTIFIDHSANDTYEDPRSSQGGLQFNFSTFDGSTFSPVKLTWRTRLLLAVFAIFGLLFIVSFTIAAIIALLVFGVFGVTLYMVKRLRDRLSGGGSRSIERRF